MKKTASPPENVLLMWLDPVQRKLVISPDCTPAQAIKPIEVESGPEIETTRSLIFIEFCISSIDIGRAAFDDCVANPCSNGFQAIFHHAPVLIPESTRTIVI